MAHYILCQKELYDSDNDNSKWAAELQEKIQAVGHTISLTTVQCAWEAYSESRFASWLDHDHHTAESALKCMGEYLVEINYEGEIPETDDLWLENNEEAKKQVLAGIEDAKEGRLVLCDWEQRGRLEKQYPYLYSVRHHFTQAGWDKLLTELGIEFTKDGLR